MVSFIEYTSSNPEFSKILIWGVHPSEEIYTWAWKGNSCLHSVIYHSRCYLCQWRLCFGRHGLFVFLFVCRCMKLSPEVCLEPRDNLLNFGCYPDYDPDPGSGIRTGWHGGDNWLFCLFIIMWLTSWKQIVQYHYYQRVKSSLVIDGNRSTRPRRGMSTM